MSDVMERLKAETADLHRSAESAEFQRRMAGGRLTREEYVAWLRQMLHVHRALEGPLRERQAGDPRFAAITPEQFQVPYLEADLTALDAESGDGALPATRSLCERIAADAVSAPLRLLGYHYVLEGSNNGNRFIARRLRPALGLTPGVGDRYLDPYGEAQPERWRRFKDEMASLPFDPDDVDVLVAAARDLFAVIGDISESLAAAPVPAASSRSTS